jgi:hypothetical protein
VGRRLFSTAVLVAAGMAALATGSAGAAEPPGATEPPGAAKATAPGQRCADGNWFVIQYTATYPGATGAADGEYERSVPTTGGCASSWAHRDGQLSTAAISSQCRTGIEKRFGPYPITLRFAETYVLRNRADCISLMSAVAHGHVDPGRAPLFPGGTR